MFEESKDPVMMELWEGQVPVDSGYDDCYYKLKRVYDEGNYVLFDWMSALLCSANIKYVRPDGTIQAVIDQDPGLWKSILFMFFPV